MGHFFTSTQIYNPKILSQKEFIDMFCKEMNKVGYVQCDSDESELSYILKFADNCKWVTITSESYEQGNQFAQQDTGRIAKILKTACINTTVIDSDCAVLDLYDARGKKADSIIMGRADDYFGDNISDPLEHMWTPFLEKEYSWQQLLNVRNGDYLFVEEGLSELSNIIGLDSEGIFFTTNSYDGGKHMVSLHFKKSTEKKEKKLTLNATIKLLFDKTLEPLGFKRVKSSYPYYVRIVDGEIVHVISVINQKKNNTNQITILAGIATVYRRKIDFSVSPQAYYNYWLFNAYELYSKLFSSDNKYVQSFSLGNCCIYAEDTNDVITSKLKNALNDVINAVVPILSEVNNFDSAAYFLLRYSSSAFFYKKTSFDNGDYLDSNETLLLTAVSDASALLHRYSDYLRAYNDFQISINRANRQYDIPKSLADLTDKINCLKAESKYIEVASEYYSSNKSYLYEL